MSGYIFNCFKERVTTGLLCSPSPGPPDVLTEPPGLLRLVHANPQAASCTHLHGENETAEEY